VQRTTSEEREARIDLTRILGANKQSVAQMLGVPTSCRRESRGEGCAYGRDTELGGATEVFFINGDAANVTLPNYGLPYAPASLEAYGIAAGEPDFISPAVTRWHTTIGTTAVEVNMFPGEAGRLFYLYVMTRD
jgi:hypothetical protein